ADPGRAQDPPYTHPRDLQPLHRRQFLGEVHIVEAVVLPAPELHDALAHPLRDPVLRGPPRVAVHDPRRSPLLDRSPQPPHLPLAESQYARGFTNSQLAPPDSFHRLQSLPLPPTHPLHPSFLAWRGRTFSLTSQADRITDLQHSQEAQFRSPMVCR